MYDDSQDCHAGDHDHGDDDDDDGDDGDNDEWSSKNADSGHNDDQKIDLPCRLDLKTGVFNSSVVVSMIGDGHQPGDKVMVCDFLRIAEFSV